MKARVSWYLHATVSVNLCRCSCRTVLLWTGIWLAQCMIAPEEHVQTEQGSASCQHFGWGDLDRVGARSHFLPAQLAHTTCAGTCERVRLNTSRPQESDRAYICPSHMCANRSVQRAVLGYAVACAQQASKARRVPNREPPTNAGRKQHAQTQAWGIR